MCEIKVFDIKECNDRQQLVEQRILIQTKISEINYDLRGRLTDSAYNALRKERKSLVSRQGLISLRLAQVKHLRTTRLLEYEKTFWRNKCKNFMVEKNFDRYSVELERNLDAIKRGEKVE